MFINGKNSILQKLVFEVRYEYGYAYLDKCGRVVNIITRSLPEWNVTAINLNGASLINVRDDSVLAFSSNKFSLVLEQGQGGSLSAAHLTNFAEQAETVSAILIEQLGLKDFTRIGFRSFHWFACNNTNESVAWLNSLGLYSVSDKLGKAFGEKTEAVSFTIIIPGKEWKYRIELNTMEQQLRVGIDQESLKVPAHMLPNNQKQHLIRQMAVRKQLKANPEFAAVVDADLFQDFPMVVSPKNFITSTYDDFTKRFEAVVSSKAPE